MDGHQWCTWGSWLALAHFHKRKPTLESQDLTNVQDTQWEYQVSSDFLEMQNGKLEYDSMSRVKPQGGAFPK